MPHQMPIIERNKGSKSCEVRSKLWYTTFVKECSLVSGKCFKHSVAIGHPAKAIPTIMHVHISSCFGQSCVRARGEISDAPSDT